MSTIKGSYSLHYSLQSPDILNFTTPKNAYYIIKIIGRAKSEKQRNSTDDEEVTISIDNKTFPKINTKKGLLNSPASINGGNLHNKEKIIFFITYLETGQHTITLTPQHQDAEIINVSFEEITINADNKVNLPLNIKLEDRDKCNWITFVLINLGLRSVNIQTHIKWQWLDGDDIQIILNGEIQQSNTTFRKDWILKTTPLDIFGKIETIHLTQELPLQEHNYIEINADKTPTLNSITFQLITEHNKQETPTIKQYKDEIYNRDYNRYDEHILTAVNYWNNFFSKQQYPPPTPLDPNLVKAMVYRESKMGYDTRNNGAIDVMQVWDERNPAKSTIIGDISEREFVDSDTTDFIHNIFKKEATPEVLTPKDSIFWGISWLYHKDQTLENLIKPYTRVWFTWEQAIRRYNANPEIVEKYISEVYSIYETGIDSDGNLLWEK